MLKRILPLVALALIMVNCNKNRLPNEDLTNKEQMNLLVIHDPLVWNSLAIQSMEIDTTDTGMKASNGMTKMKEYPNKGYYYTFFEDLFPSQSDYDFNDVMLESKFSLEGKKGEVWGEIDATVFHKGGTLPVKIGLLFYSVKGNKEYTVIENADLMIDDEQMTGNDPYIMDMPAKGEKINIKYFITDRTNNVNQLWISWFIVVESGGESHEIHTSGFSISTKKNFNIPQRDYLTAGNLPWGLTIEAEEFYIPKETEVFLLAFPEFQEWAESEGVKNKKWFENPDMDYIQ